jgi:predicted nucleic acid-binding protein
VIFVDTNVFVYAVGGPHPLRDPARAFFSEALAEGTPLATSAEVLQELLHVYLPVNRLDTLDAALTLARGLVGTVWEVEAEDVMLARSLVTAHPGLGARDLVHLACCTRRDCNQLKTFDRGLAASWD